MSARARAALGERDGNHSEVAGWFTEEYCETVDTSKLGGGFPDLVAGISTRRGKILVFVEVKTLDGALSSSQKTFARNWPVTVIRTRTDVTALVDGVRARFK